MRKRRIRGSLIKSQKVKCKKCIYVLVGVMYMKMHPLFDRLGLLIYHFRSCSPMDGLMRILLTREPLTSYFLTVVTDLIFISSYRSDF
jgi:hypothetical protein